MPGVSFDEVTKAASVAPVRQEVLPEPDTGDVSFGEGVSAGYQLNAPTLNIGRMLSDSQSFEESGAYDPDFDPAQHVGGYEDHWDYLSQSLNEAEMNLRKRVIDRDQELRRKVELGGAAAMTGALLGAVADPISLATLAAPLGYGVKLGGALRGAAAAGGTLAAETAAIEAALHAAQPTRTPMESVYNVSGAVLVGGLLGSVVGAFEKGAATRLASEIEDELTGGAGFPTNTTPEVDDLLTRLEGQPASAGAAAVDTDPVILAGGGAVRRAASLSPIGRLASASSAAARDLGLRLAGNALRVTSAKTGAARPTPLSAESFIKQWTGRVNVARLNGITPAWRDYRTRVKAAGGKALSKRQFRVEVGKAMRRGDSHPTIPEAGTAAKALRKVVEPLFREGVKARVFDDFVRSLAREESDEPFERLKHQRRAALKDFKRFLRLNAKQRRRNITAAARAEQKDLTALRDTHVKEIELFYDSRLDQMKEDAAADLSWRLGQHEELTDGMRAEAKAAVGAEYDAKVNAWKERREAHIAMVKKVYGSYNAQQRTITKNVYSARIEQLRQVGRAKKNELLSKIDKFDTVARAKIEKEVDRETRLAIRALARQEKDTLKDAVKQYKQDKRLLLKERNDAWRDLNKELDRALDDMEADFAMPKRGDFSDAVFMAYLKETPDEYLTKSVRESVEALTKRIDQEATNGSYLTRAYDTDKVLRNPGAMAKAIADHWVAASKGKLAPETALEQAQEAVKKITGYGHHGAPYALRGPTRASMQLQRELLVPDEVIEPWLLSDADHIVMDYARKIGARVELSKASSYYGENGAWRLGKDMDDIRDEYEALSRAAKTEDERVKIAKERDQRIYDLAAVRDRLLGVYDLKPGDEIGVLSRIGANLKEVNFLSRMGNMAVASVSDLAQPILAFGVMKSYGKLIHSLGRGVAAQAFKMTRSELLKAGTAAELVTPLVTKLASDFGDVPVNQYLHATGQVFSHATGMTVWNTVMKTFAGIMAQDEVLGTAARLAPKIAAGTLSKSDQRLLADLYRMGVSDEMIEKMAGQPVVKMGNLTLADTDSWTDALLVNQYRAALANMVDTMIISPGAGDKFRWIKGQTAGLVTQFKSFAISAHTKALIPFMQDPDKLRQVSAVTAAMGMGAIVMHLRAAIADAGTGDTKRTDALEEMYRNGEWYGLGRQIVGNTSLGTLFTEVDTLGGFALGLEGAGRFPMSSAAQALLGPSIGYGETAFDVAQAAGADPFTGSTVHKIRSLMPFQNVFYLNGLFNQVEQEVVEHYGLKPRKTQ